MSTQPNQLHTDWAAPPTRPALGRDEVHVWHASLEPPPAGTARLLEVLDRDERQRAARYVFERDRSRFIIARAVLRHLLSRYLSRPPAEFAFEHNAYGKPALKTSSAATPLYFNVSHSGDKALYAFSADGEVGVDVELVREDFATGDIAERFFSPREVRSFKSLPPHARTEGFFNCWTRKEAYIKALGRGLSHPLDSFTVTLAPGSPAELLADETGLTDVSRWSLRELHLAPDYAAALAVPRRGWQLHCYDWQRTTQPRPII